MFLVFQYSLQQRRASCVLAQRSGGVLEKSRRILYSTPSSSSTCWSSTSKSYWSRPKSQANPLATRCLYPYQSRNDPQVWGTITRKRSRSFFTVLQNFLRGGATTDPDPLKEPIATLDDIDEEAPQPHKALTYNVARNRLGTANARISTICSSAPIGSSASGSITDTDAPPSSSAVSFPVSIQSIQGHRKYMEDDFVLGPDFCAVFDGHGGSKVSQYLRHNLYAEAQAALVLRQHQVSRTIEQYEHALVAALKKVDDDVQKLAHWSYQGSTAVALWFHEEKITASSSPQDDDNSQQAQPVNSSSGSIYTLITANVGDSRAVLSRNATAIALTRDHKPSDPMERERIELTGGKVAFHGFVDGSGKAWGVHRVNGNLSLSRAIGDRSERPAISGSPELCTVTLEPGLDDFVVIATDGLWDVLDSEHVVEFIHAYLAENVARDLIAEALVKEALTRGSFDNITIVIVWLDSMRR